jgi:hypothetical protein
MNGLAKGMAAVLTVVLLAGSALAADAVTRGKIKSTNPDKNEFVMDDPNGKSNTFTLGDNVIIHRGGKDVKFADLKVGDDVSVCYDQGLLKWTVHYALVHEGDTKNLELGRGTIKAYDADKGELVMKDLNNTEWTFAVPATSKVQINTQPSKMAEVKVGETATIVYDKQKDAKKPTMAALIVQRKQ